MTKRAGSGAGSGFVSQRYGFADPDPYENVTGKFSFSGLTLQYNYRLQRVILRTSDSYTVRTW